MTDPRGSRSREAEKLAKALAEAKKKIFQMQIDTVEMVNEAMAGKKTAEASLAEARRERDELQEELAKWEGIHEDRSAEEVGQLLTAAQVENARLREGLRPIARYLQPAQRAKWERRLLEGMDETEDYPECTPDQRAVLWTLKELKDAEAIIEGMRALLHPPSAEKESKSDD